MTAPLEPNELNDVRLVVMKGALLALLFVMLQLAELFVLPIDFFTFRVWEAALAAPYAYPGWFYPNLHVKKENEFGDRYRSGDPRMVERKSVEWFTDSYGWRNRTEVEKRDKYDIVVLGDSNIVGSFLDQKDILSEVLSSRGGLTAYSYSLGSAHIAPFFSDPRMRTKSPKLVVSESKVGNWDTNNSYLVNFIETSDGALDVLDVSEQFTHGPYSSPRNYFYEQLHSRLLKQPMFHLLKSELRVDFKIPPNSQSDVITGSGHLSRTERVSGWQPINWIVESGSVKPLEQGSAIALSLRALGVNSYWHTERFVSSRSDGKIVVRFDAKNSMSQSRHRVYIFEDGSYRSIGEISAGRNWKTFEIPITTKPQSLLEFQIDQLDSWQWLSIRNVQIIGAESLPLAKEPPVTIPMAAWTGDSTACLDSNREAQDCRQWIVAGKKGYVQTPVLPPAGKDGLLIQFDARTDRPASAFVPVYLFEGEKYRVVTQYAIEPQWREFSVLLKPAGNAPLKIQVDYPEAVGVLAIRNFKATPAELMTVTGSNHVGR